jgi:hypothetical protein
VGLVAKIQLEKEGGQDQSAHHEDRDPNYNIEGTQWQQQSAGQKGEKRLRDVIEAYGHATRSQVQPAFYEAGKKIADHGKGRE